MKAPRKKRVVLSYEIVAGAALTREILEQAFASQREVVAPPLESILALDGPIARVRAQYEPPNSGGHSGDVDRILARVVRKLEAEGLGPVQYRRT